MADKVPVNGLLCTWAQMTISLDGDVDTTCGLKEIKYSDSVDGASLVYGPGKSSARGSTKGRSAPTCSAVFFRPSWDQFAQAHLAGIAGGFTTKLMSLTVSYEIDTGDIRTDKIESARITKVEAGGSDGTDPAEVSVEFLVIKPIKWHGDLTMT